ncbi:unnamed protein product [Closterium sp. NIES-53]
MASTISAAASSIITFTHNHTVALVSPADPRRSSMISARGATSVGLQPCTLQLGRPGYSESLSSRQFTLRRSLTEHKAFRGATAPRGTVSARKAVLVSATRDGGGGVAGGNGGDDVTEWWEREERRWEREQQRWEREELRWEREEARWTRERASLESEIAALKVEVESLRAALTSAGGGGLTQSSPSLLPQAQAQLAEAVGGGMGGGVGGTGGLGSDLSKQQLLVLLRGLTHLLQITTDSHRASEVATSAAIATSSGVIAGAGAESLLQLLGPTASATGNATAGATGGATAVDGVRSTAGVAGATAEEILRNVPDADIIAAVASRTVNPLPADVDEGGADVAVATPGAGKQEEGARKGQRKLNRGLYGDDVAQLQAALARQGFYCGEEDEEDEFFGANTESAVKTWQATMKLQEDGIVTPALFSLLVGNPRPAAEPATKPAPELPAKPSTEPSSSSSSQVSPRAPPATREKREIERYARSDLEMGQRRVFLLGENRWEDPNTLIGRGGEEVEGKEEGGEEEEEEERGEVEGKGKGRGGRDLVDVKGKGKGKKGKKGGDGECEGTGDLNIEEQFLDWVEDGACCLYCNGTGAITCDLCDGSGK